MYKEEQIRQSRLSIPQNNLALLFCIPNMNFLYSCIYRLYSCGDIFDEKCEEKEKRTYTRKNTQENASSQSHNVISYCQLTYKILTLYLEQWLRYLLRKITVLIASEQEKITNIR